MFAVYCLLSGSVEIYNLIPHKTLLKISVKYYFKVLLLQMMPSVQ